MTQTPPTNGTGYRLDNIEERVGSLEQAVKTNTQAMTRMETHLTGEGVKGSRGVLGEIADSQQRIAEAVEKTQQQLEINRQSIKDEVRDEVARQLKEADIQRKVRWWGNLSRGARWVLGSVVGAVIATLVGLLIAFLLNLTIKLASVPSAHP